MVKMNFRIKAGVDYKCDETINLTSLQVSEIGINIYTHPKEAKKLADMLTGYPFFRSRVEVTDLLSNIAFKQAVTMEISIGLLRTEIRLFSGKYILIIKEVEYEKVDEDYECVEGERQKSVHQCALLQ